MLRASLVAMSAGLMAALVQVPVAEAGSYHHPHQRPAARGMIAASGNLAVRPMRPVVRPAVPVQPIYVGYPQPVFPVYESRRAIVIDNGPPPGAVQNVTVTVNPVPVVVGIRRAPEAVPVIYRIAEGRAYHRMRRQEYRQIAPSAGVHHAAPDTTTPRIIIVRGAP
jgi:hypothetical protein